ncbi:MAG: hypothetical protein FWD00_03995 [Clostridiales bacterium]|nr:hypothetical protein [Clostridiales bacterium]
MVLITETEILSVFLILVLICAIAGGIVVITASATNLALTTDSMTTDLISPTGKTADLAHTALAASSNGHC